MVIWLVLLAFILSNLYHLNMFTKYSIWKEIGKLDAEVSAPLDDYYFAINYYVLSLNSY